jgi:serine-type D-Ala-D-Ala carboxypeptidase (penicillin-binding protein 5/6)
VSDPHPAPLVVAPFPLDSLRDAAPLAPPAPNGSRGSRGPGPRGKRTHPRSRRPRRRRWARRLFVAALILAILVGAAGAFVDVRLSRPDPLPVLRSEPLPPLNLAAQPIASALPWPVAGQGAVAVPALGVDIAPDTQEAVPVASLTKLMTAYIILHDHPLAVGSPGPSITVTEADVADYGQDIVNDDSSVAVKLGEVLTERQLMGGLLVHSADNFADLLAAWDAGSVPAFVAKMNATALSLGMDHSHFADPSGISPQSESTAYDIAKVASLDMENPNVRAIVRMPDITLPVAGTVGSYTPLLGLDGIVGVKSGFTDEAGGGDVVAVVPTIQGVPVMLLAAVTSQQGPNVLNTAALHGLALVDALDQFVGRATVLHKGQLVARVTSDGRTVTATAASSVSMLTWPGTTATSVFHPVRHLTDQARRGARVGTVVVTLGGQQALVPVRLTQNVPRETTLQRIF